MTIIFLKDKVAESLEIKDTTFMRIKLYNIAPGSVVVNEHIYTEKEFIKMPGRIALKLLKEEAKQD